MNKNNQNINLLPFDELLALHQAGQLSSYAEKITHECIAQCQGGEALTLRLQRLAFKLAAIRAKHPTGLKAYLEINNLLASCHHDFLDSIEEILKGRKQQLKPKEPSNLLKFPGCSNPGLSSSS